MDIIYVNVFCHTVAIIRNLSWCVTSHPRNHPPLISISKQERKTKMAEMTIKPNYRYPCFVCCCGLITCLLYVSTLIGNLFLNSWSVSLYKAILSMFVILFILICLHVFGYILMYEYIILFYYEYFKQGLIHAKHPCTVFSIRFFWLFE